MTRVATGGARTTENCVATGGAKRNDAMKSNGTKGSPLAAPELSEKSVQPCPMCVCMYVCMYISDWLQLQCSFIQPMFHMAVSIQNYFKASDDCIYFPQFHLPAVTQNTCPCNILACCLSYTPTYVCNRLRRIRVDMENFEAANLRNRCTTF